MTAWHAWNFSVSQNQHEQWLTNKLRYSYLHKSSWMFRISWDWLTAVCVFKKKDSLHWSWPLWLVGWEGAGCLVSGWVEMQRGGPCSVPMDAMCSTVWRVFLSQGFFLKHARPREQRLFFYLIWGKGLVPPSERHIRECLSSCLIGWFKSPRDPSCDPRCVRMRRDGEGSG